MIRRSRRLVCRFAALGQAITLVPGALLSNGSCEAGLAEGGLVAASSSSSSSRGSRGSHSSRDSFTGNPSADVFLFPCSSANEFVVPALRRLNSCSNGPYTNKFVVPALRRSNSCSNVPEYADESVKPPKMLEEYFGVLQELKSHERLLEYNASHGTRLGEVCWSKAFTCADSFAYERMCGEIADTILEPSLVEKLDIETTQRGFDCRRRDIFYLIQAVVYVAGGLRTLHDSEAPPRADWDGRGVRFVNEEVTADAVRQFLKNRHTFGQCLSGQYATDAQLRRLQSILLDFFEKCRRWGYLVDRIERAREYDVFQQDSLQLNL